MPTGAFRVVYSGTCMMSNEIFIDEIARHLASNEEVQSVVTALEQQYDTFARAEAEGSNLLASGQPLPTGEEIGQQFEHGGALKLGGRPPAPPWPSLANNRCRPSMPGVGAHSSPALLIPAPRFSTTP